MSVVRRQLERLGPYQALFMLAVPALCVEPLKFVAVAVAGKGHWLTGATMITAAYAFSLLVLERLFVIVKPKLLKVRWFAIMWDWFVKIRTALFAPCRYLAASSRIESRLKSMGENQIDQAGGNDVGSSMVSLRLPHQLLSTVAAIARSESISVTEAFRQMIERGVQAWVEEQR